MDDVNRVTRKFSINLLSLTGYLVLFAVGVVSILQIDSIFERWIALGILILLGVLRGTFWPYQKGFRLIHIFLGAETILSILLFGLAPKLDYLPLLFFVFSVDAMLLFSMRTGLLWIGGFILINGAYFIYYFGWREGLETLAIFGSGYIFFGVFANALYRSQEAQLKSQKLLKELEAANRQLKDYTKQVETLTAAQERNRLAREMHDTVGHHLTVVAVQLEGAQRLIKADSEKASALITTAREQVRLALQEARQTVSRLRSPLEADLPLAQSLEQLTADFQDATGLVIHLTLPEAIPFLPESHRLALYRSAQEALTNVQRHAQARVVDVDLRQGEDEITLRIRDDGIGGNLASETQGYGLLGLKERAAQLGGTAEWYDRCMADSTQHGLELVIRLPMMGSKNG